MPMLENGDPRCEAKSHLPGRLQPEWREDDVLHNRVNISVRPLERTVDVKGGRPRRFVHGPDYDRGNVRGVVPVSHRCARCAVVTVRPWVQAAHTSRSAE